MQVAPVRVPNRTKAFVEGEAHRLLLEYAEETGAGIDGPIPVEEIARYHLCLQLEFADLHEIFNVPKQRGGPDILGAMFFERSAILIDECLNPDTYPHQLGRYRFSLAHEIGHWRLHRDAMARRKEAAADQPAVVCRQSEASTVPAEFQADTFASCLLLPRERVFEQWRVMRGTEEAFAFEVGSHGSPGLRRLWFGLSSDEADARIMFTRECTSFFEEQSAGLAKVFAVSPAAMRVRLEGLGLLQRARRRAQPVSQCG